MVNSSKEDLPNSNLDFDGKSRNEEVLTKLPQVATLFSVMEIKLPYLYISSLDSSIK
jgi:hypothetical protein